MKGQIGVVFQGKSSAQSIGSIPLKPKKCKNQIFTEKPGDWGFLPGNPGLGQLRDLKSYHCSGPSPLLTRGRRTGIIWRHKAIVVKYFCRYSAHVAWDTCVHVLICSGMILWSPDPVLDQSRTLVKLIYDEIIETSFLTGWLRGHIRILCTVLTDKSRLTPAQNQAGSECDQHLWCLQNYAEYAGLLGTLHSTIILGVCCTIVSFQWEE